MRGIGWAVALGAMASLVPGWARPVDLHALHRSRLTPVHAPAGTSETQFARKIGRGLQRFTNRTGTEACADLCRSPQGAWGAIPVSIGAHAACSTLRECPEGMTPVGRMIHSHPDAAGFEPNAVDFALRNKPLIEGMWWNAGDPTLFSDADYAEPGYLVVQGHLYFQAGRGTERRLGPVDAPR